VSSEGTEPVREGYNDVSAEGIVPSLPVNSVTVRNTQVLGLVQENISAQSEGELVLEQQLVDLGIDDDFVFLRS
jgi:hypothetical protein